MNVSSSTPASLTPAGQLRQGFSYKICLLSSAWSSGYKTRNVFGGSKPKRTTAGFWTTCKQCAAPVFRFRGRLPRAHRKSKSPNRATPRIAPSPRDSICAHRPAKPDDRSVSTTLVSSRPRRVPSLKRPRLSIPTRSRNTNRRAGAPAMTAPKRQPERRSPNAARRPDRSRAPLYRPDTPEPRGAKSG